MRLIRLRPRPWPSRLPVPWARRLLRLVVLLVVAALLTLPWPYLTLWRLNAVIQQGTPQALAPMVRIESVREQIRRRLNKEAASHIGEVSDPFIDWIQRSIRRADNDGLQQSVTLEWLYGLLSMHATPGRGFLPAVSQAVFVSPVGFRVRIGAGDIPATTLRLGLGWSGWRVVAAYY
ncbi:DUF2939 domain-containing protein [Thiohalocapsa marina]|uniref:DUF2939 domain-containing protein n=1 Tax=Thiohalocapsa marina TaxID=424902 RepID=A0A5M8FU64_9GAMM|nr:DUF2939 domain-containing protein [Thiohalocapsa marina]KAA6187336.1 DUF2939 domain-containing protein [Thiohalocapsa marina]